MVRHAIHNSRDISISEEPISLYMRSSTIRAREGYKDIPLIVGDNVAAVDLCRVLLENLKNPKILCSTDAKISIS